MGVTDLLGLSASAIVRTDLTCKANGIYLSHGVDPEVERLYAAGYGNQDVYRPRFLRMQGRQGELVMGDELCTVDEMKSTAFYQDILLKADVRLWCAVATVHGEGIIENISFYHRWKDEAPGADYLKIGPGDHTAPEQCSSHTSKIGSPGGLSDGLVCGTRPGRYGHRSA